MFGAPESFGISNTVEFAIRTPNGTYGSYQTLNASNLSGAIASLSGYSASTGLRAKIKVTSLVNNEYQSINQISLLTNINPSLWSLNDSNINIR